MTIEPFGGAKVAILSQGCVLVIRRDDFEHIPFPDHWDLPGGGREGDETPSECVLRELAEELGLALNEADLHWQKDYSRPLGLPGRTWMFVSVQDEFDPATVVMGDEGQGWQMMPVQEFLDHPKAVPHLVQRLRDYEAEVMPPRSSNFLDTTRIA
jgi:8-oxo-dGTP diphosphatase